jgi:putative IMPACT (imprinted ancient) family translation regulator
MDPFYYYTIEKPSMAEFKDRGSKFFAFAYPAKDIDSCKKILAQLKK